MTLGFFPYSPLYYEGAQEYLDKKAARGLALQKVYLGCVARFEKAEGPHHFVDLKSAQDTYDDPMRTYKDYLQLCDDAGWELIQELRGMFLFRSKPGAHPLPIQTDGEMEWERFWEKNRPRLRTTLVLLAAFAFLALVLMISPPSSWEITPILLNNITLLVSLYWLLSILYGLSSWIFSKWYLSKCKQSGRVEPPGWVAVVLDGTEVFHKVFALVLIPLIFINILLPPALNLRSNMFEDTKTATVAACQEHPVVMAYDLGVSDDTEDNYSRYLTLRRSLLCEYYDYSELSHSADEKGQLYILATERYDCVSEALAKLVFDLRSRETRNGAATTLPWWEMAWEDAPGLGFEESYLCHEGACLLLRQGKVVALVSSSGVDLTTPKNLQIIRARLDLPPV